MANWQKEADKMWAKVIKQVGYCERCGRSDFQLHAHHIIKRRSYAYRHDISNGVCLCASCHTMGPLSAHNDNSNFLSWVKKERPGQWDWFLEHTVEDERVIGNETHIVYLSKPGESRDDEIEYNELKEIFDKGE